MLFQYPVAGSSRTAFQYLVDWGLLDALLPFVLIFTLMYAILMKVQLFKEGNEASRRINGVLAFVISLMVVVPHIMGYYSPSSDPIVLINKFLPSTAAILIAVFCVMILLGLTGKVPNIIVWLVALGAVGALIWIIISAMNPQGMPQITIFQDPAIQALLIILLVFGLIGFFIVRPPSSGGGFSMDKFEGGLKKLFGGD